MLFFYLFLFPSPETVFVVEVESFAKPVGKIQHRVTFKKHTGDTRGTCVVLSVFIGL